MRIVVDVMDYAVNGGCEFTTHNGNQTHVSRVYDVYVAPYYSLDSKTYTSYCIFRGESITTDAFATGSMPTGGKNHRSYVSYVIVKMQDEQMISAWINYTHQHS